MQRVRSTKVACGSTRILCIYWPTKIANLLFQTMNGWTKIRHSETELAVIIVDHCHCNLQPPW